MAAAPYPGRAASPAGNLAAAGRPVPARPPAGRSAPPGPARRDRPAAGGNAGTDHRRRRPPDGAGTHARPRTLNRLRRTSMISASPHFQPGRIAGTLPPVVLIEGEG